MQDKLIDCHSCNRCNELTVAFEKTLEAFGRFKTADANFKYWRDRLDASTKLKSNNQQTNQLALLKAYILLEGAMKSAKTKADNELIPSLMRVQDDIRSYRIVSDRVVEAMKFNAIEGWKLVREIEALFEISQQKLNDCDDLMPTLNENLDRAFVEAYKSCTLA